MFKSLYKKIAEVFNNVFNWIFEIPPLSCDLSFYDQFDIDKTEDFIDMVQYIESDDNNIWESRIRDRRTGTSTAIILSALSQAFRLHKNVIIVTARPRCSYYFGENYKKYLDFTDRQNIDIIINNNTIKFQNGNYIKFIYIKDADKFRGLRSDLIVFDCISESDEHFEYWKEIISHSHQAKIRTFHQNEDVKYEN